MIHPAYGSKLKYRPSQRSYFLYYSVAFLLCLANLVPLLTNSDDTAKINGSTQYFLGVCYLIPLPLLFEFVLDAIAAQFQALGVLKELEHRFGHGLLLISLFLDVILTLGDQVGSISVLAVNCLFGLMQTVAITGVYGKLQAHGDGHWTVGGSWSVVSFFVLSELFTRFGMMNHDEGSVVFRVCLAGAVISSVGSFLLHFYFTKKFLAHYLGIKIGSSVPCGPSNIDDIVCFILQAIVSVFLLVSICSNTIFLMDGKREQYTNFEILKQMVLALCAAVLPGRTIRRSFILLKHEMETKESFVRYISHEIRSPLSTTSLGLDYLIERMSNTNSPNSSTSNHRIDSADPISSLTMAEALGVMQETKVTCELAMNTLNDFLMLDKIQNNMLQISTVECAAADFMINTVKSFKLQALTNEVALTCSSQVIDGVDILSLPITVEVDQYKINQVIRNLFSNALKFTPPRGSIEVSMLLRNAVTGKDVESMYELTSAGGGDGSNRSLGSNTKRGDCMVRYAVKDSGCGISKENLPKLFGQYVQFDADKLQGGKGSGLGLWLSKAIVEMHGGRIGATSEGIGEGCTFWFELPCEVTVLNSSFKCSGGAGGAVSKKLAATHSTTMCISDSGFFDFGGDKDAVEEGEEGASALFTHRRKQQTNEYFTVPEAVLEVFDIESGNHHHPHTHQHNNHHPNRRLSTATSASSVEQPSVHLDPTSFSAPVPATAAESKGTTAAAAASAFTITRGDSVGLLAVDSLKIRLPPPRHSPAITRRKHRYSRPTSLRVLLVDDSSIARKMVERQLNKIGALSYHAVHGREAVKMVWESLKHEDLEAGIAATNDTAQVKYDVILMDYHMPEMTGPEAIVQIRSLGYSGVILAVSAMTSEDSEFTHLLNAGQIDRIMLKPFNLEIFQCILNDVMV